MPKQLLATPTTKSVGRTPASPRHNNAIWRAFRLPTQSFDEYIRAYFTALDHPVALSCLLLYEAREYAQLVAKEVSPHDYNCAEDFRGAFAAVSLLRKYPNFNTGIDRRAVSLENFGACEAACKSVNRLIVSNSWGKKPQDDWLLNATRRKIALILHAVNENDRCQGFDIDRVLDSGSWGPGSTLSIKGDDTSASIKFQDERDLTSDLYDLYGTVLAAAYPGWIPEKQCALRFRAGNKIVTVPKNAKTDRTIAIEPGINSFVQLGIGRLIRHRLRQAGFDLNSDSRNREGAFIGSKTASLSTVDFSSASDTIAREVVRFLLPPVWYEALDAARSHYYELDGRTCEFHKFSTMGCGFTFELESLIFVAAALAVCEYCNAETKHVSVFGDDVILPSSCFDVYADFCMTLGFTVNKKKSYSTSYFRESCGSYYFAGVDVKPIFLKKKVTTVADCYGFANAVRLFSHRAMGNLACDKNFLPLWQLVIRHLGKKTLFGPSNFGDICLASNFDEATPCRARNQLEGFYFSGWVARARTVVHDSHGHLLARLSSIGPESTPLGNDVPLRAIVQYTIKRRILAPLWYNFGPWI